MATDKSTETFRSLIHAVLERNENEVRTLIDACADVHKTDHHGKTALFHAVQESNNESVVRILIDAGADVNKTDDDGKTALFHAVPESNNESVVRILIDAGADVNKTDDDGKTALFHAVQESNNESVVHALIDAGADVNKTYDDGKTALFHAVQESNKESVVRILIDAGAYVNKTYDDGKTALFHAVEQSNNESVVRALIDAGADVNKTDHDSKTALFHAVKESNNESVVRELIDAGADVNKTDNDSKTALFHAVQESNNENVVCALIAADGSVSINMRDVYGRTPLFYALKYPNSALILIEKGIEHPFFLKDNFNCSILDVFVNCHLFHGSITKDTPSQKIPPGFLDLLDKCGVQEIRFAEAILNMVFCKFPIMFQNDSNVLGNVKTHITRALELAGQFIDNQEEMENLIALINQKCTNGEGVSEALQLLFELGADPNSFDSDGNTALHYATGLALEGVPQEIVMEICHELEKLGVQFNWRNYEKQTPLMFCLSKDVRHSSSVKSLVEVCKLLLANGSNIEERSRSGETVFHLILKLFQQVLRLRDKAVRQDVLPEMIKLLPILLPSKVNQRGIINISDADLNSPLHHWASLELPYSEDYSSNVTRDLTFEEFLQTILNSFIKCGAILDARNVDDQTPLHLCRTWIAVKLLLDAGANANNLDSSRASPLVVVAKRSIHDDHDNLFPDVSGSEDTKSFWKTAIDKGLDPWTADNEGVSVLGCLIERDNFTLAKALVDVACEEGHTQSEKVSVDLVNAICKDKSTRTNWKANLVQDILKSRKGSITLNEPLHLCCRNVIETGVLDNKAEEKSPSAAIEMMAASEHDETFGEGQPKSKKRKMDTSEHSTDEGKSENMSVHCEIIKVLRLYGADGESCMDLAHKSDALKELLIKPLDLNSMSVLIQWTSFSNKYEVKLAKVARRQECDVLHEKFWCHKEPIGSGSYGYVFVGINEKDGREVAIKRIVKLRMQRPEDKREIINLTTLADCEQVVRYLHFFEEEMFSYIVLELMEGNLDEYLTNGSTFDATKGTKLCEDVVKGLKFLHAKDIIHRDLKPGNILFKKHPHLRLKIADFGLSRRIDSSATTVYGTNAGTRCWMAPELLKSGTTDDWKASDMFSCGLVLHYILSVQKHPFSKNNSQMPHQVETNIANGRMEGWDDSLSPEATHVVKNMLQGDENNRPTAGKALDYPLFWSNKKKVDLLIAVGNHPVFLCPRAKRPGLTPVETDLENNFRTIVMHGKWNDPRYKDMPAIYTEMTKKRKSYNTSSVVELVRFIRNAYAHVSEVTRPTPFKKMFLEEFVFLEYFPHLVMEVYKVVTDHGWAQTEEEIKYAMNK